MTDWRTMILRGILASLLILGMAATAPAQQESATDWPEWRGPQRSGVATEPGWRPSWPASPNIVWRASVGKGFSSLAVAKDRVYTLGKSGHLFCLNAATGDVVWSKQFEPAPRQEGDYHVDWGYAASPLILKERLILSNGWAGLHRLADGREPLVRSRPGLRHADPGQRLPDRPRRERATGHRPGHQRGVPSAGRALGRAVGPMLDRAGLLPRTRLRAQ